MRRRLRRAVDRQQRSESLVSRSTVALGGEVSSIPRRGDGRTNGFPSFQCGSKSVFSIKSSFVQQGCVLNHWMKHSGCLGIFGPLERVIEQCERARSNCFVPRSMRRIRASSFAPQSDTCEWKAAKHVSSGSFDRFDEPRIVPFVDVLQRRLLGSPIPSKIGKLLQPFSNSVFCLDFEISFVLVT